MGINNSIINTQKIISFFAIFSLMLLLANPALADQLPDNRVSLSMTGFDADSYTEVGGQPTGTGEFTNGNISAYPLDSCVPIVVYAENRSNTLTGDILFTPSYDYFNDANQINGILNLEHVTSSFSDPRNSVMNLDELTFTGNSLGSVVSFQTLSGLTLTADVQGPFADNDDGGTDPISSTDEFRHYNITIYNVPPEEIVSILFCARLSSEADQYPGSSMMVGIGNPGKESISINTYDNSSTLPSITISKQVVNGIHDPDEWSFVVNPEINSQSVYTIPAGQTSLTIADIAVDGDYTITEAGPAGYAFDSGSGNNCSFANDGIATASVAAGSPATDATCAFVNQGLPSTITVIKQVINDDQGTAATADFTLYINGNTVISGQANTLSPGDYTISEDASNDYTASFSGDCDSSGQLTLGLDEDLICTITNDDVAAVSNGTTLTVIKQVINDNGLTKAASDFNINVSGTNASPVIFTGDDQNGVIVTLDPGDYNVWEVVDPNYAVAYSADCSGQIAAGENRQCIITNDDSASPVDVGTLTVTTIVINDNGRTMVPGDVTITISTTPVLTMFGSDAGVTFDIVTGDYAVQAPSMPYYTRAYSGDCTGSISAGQNLSCTITYNDRSSGGSGGSGGGGGSSTPPTTTDPATADPEPPQEILGEQIDAADPPVIDTPLIAPAPDSAQTPTAVENEQQVLGYKTLPQAGINFREHLIIMLIGLGYISLALLLLLGFKKQS